MGYVYVLGTILFTVYGQLILKWKINQMVAFSTGYSNKIIFLANVLLQPSILSGLASAFIASLCWMMAMTKLNLSTAYPFMSVSFVAVIIVSNFLFNEPIGLLKIIGVAFIVGGICMIGLGEV